MQTEEWQGHTKSHSKCISTHDHKKTHSRCISTHMTTYENTWYHMDTYIHICKDKCLYIFRQCTNTSVRIQNACHIQIHILGITYDILHKMPIAHPYNLQWCRKSSIHTEIFILAKILHKSPYNWCIGLASFGEYITGQPAYTYLSLHPMTLVRSGKGNTPMNGQTELNDIQINWYDQYLHLHRIIENQWGCVGRWSPKCKLEYLLHNRYDMNYWHDKTTGKKCIWKNIEYYIYTHTYIYNMYT